MSKRIAIGVLMLVSSALSFVSCQQADNYMPASDVMTVTAYTDESHLTRTSLGDAGSVLWNTTDHISLFYNKDSKFTMADFVCSSVSEGGRKATFSGSSLADGASGYVALYPYDAEAECSSKGKLSSSLRGLQTADAGTFDRSAAISIARGADKDNLYFRNVCSLVGIKPQLSGVTSVTLIGSAPLTGEFESKSDGTLVLGKTSRAVRLISNMNAGSEYYASVFPGTHTAMKIVLGKSDGSFASLSGGALTMGPNELRHLFDGAPGSWKQSKQLYINEVKCGPDSPGVNEKKIEIYNPNDVAVSLWGWTIVKDDSQMFAFAEGSSIAAHGYYVITCRQDSETATTATFGLSGDKGFKIQLCHGSVIDELDNSGPLKVIVDGYTYGRRSDGGTPWVLFSTGSIGADNSTGTEYIPEPTKTGVNLNEISAPQGWIELHNTGATNVNLSGFKAYLNEEHKPVWIAASSDAVSSGGFFTFNVSSLSARKNFTLTVEDGAGDIVGTYSRGSKGEGWGTYSLPENTAWSYSYVGGGWVYASPTKGAANSVKSADIESCTKVILNEINGDYTGGDYIELYNPGVSTEFLDDFKIRRYRMKDGIEDEQTLWKGTGSVVIAPGSYLTLYYKGDLDDNKTYPLQLQRDFSAKKNASLWLQDDRGIVVSSFTRGTRNSGWNNISMQKVENPSTGVPYSYSYVGGTWVYANPTPGAVNGVKAYDIDQTMCPVVINEINLAGGWVELYNMGDASVTTPKLQLMWYISGDNVEVWSGSLTMNSGEFVKIDVTGILTGGYSQKNIRYKLRTTKKTVDATGEKYEWDDFKRGTEGTGWTTVTLGTNITRSIIRVPDGSGDWYLGNASPAVTNGTDKSGGKCPDVNQ